MPIKRLIQVCLILVLLLASFASTGSTRAKAADTGAVSAWSGCGSTYVVRQGDWLAKIARTCGVTLSQLYAANPWVRSYSYIYPGWTLVIPGGDPGPRPDPHPGGWHACGPAADGYGSYWVVCRGDTLGRIARYYGVSWRYLQDHNGIANPNRIYPGQVIRL